MTERIIKVIKGTKNEGIYEHGTSLCVRFFVSNMVSACRRIPLLLEISLLSACFSCSTKSPIEKWHEMYDKEWAQSQLDSILSPYLHMDWDTASLKISFSDVVPPIVEEFGTCREYGNKRLKVYSVWSLPFENVNGAYPISFYVRHGDVTVLSKANDGSINIELDSTEFVNAVLEYERAQNEKAEEKRAALQERKDAVELSNRNRTRVHFGMSSKEYYSNDKLFRENFVNGLIGDGAFDSHFEPYFANGKFVGFEISSSGKINFDNVINYASMTKSHRSEGVRFDSHEANYISNLYNLQIYELYSSRSFDGTTIKVWWNKHATIYK